MSRKVYRILLGLFCLFSRYTSSLTNTLEGYFFEKVSFHYLEGIVAQTSAVYDDFQCVLSCKRSPECLSLNIADQPNKASGLYECVLLLRNQTRKSTGLTPSHLYHHYTYRPECTTSSPLGMKSGAIPDSSITASTYFWPPLAPHRARLDAIAGGSKQGAWAAAHNNLSQWLQVDLGTVTTVMYIATQGRSDYSQWVTSYALQYSFDGEFFFDYEAGKVFAGNSDRNTVVKHALNPVIAARYIRVRPKTWYKRISIRMELYGCRLN